MFSIHRLSLAALPFLAIACGAPAPPKQAQDPIQAPKGVPAAKRVTDRPANLQGSVFIVEYHRIAKEEARWDRSISRFKADLERYYRMGFRPVTLSQFLDNKMQLPPGASPIVFTFDDSQLSQFHILPDGSVDPDCAIGIWLDFAERHPDFPVLASFYVLPPVPWVQKESLEKKLNMLREWGCEVGSHTMTHGQLSKLTDEKVKSELAGAIDFIAGLGFEARTLALPFGISPKNVALLKGFAMNGKTYRHTGALLVGANPAPAPTSPKLNPMRIPRIQAIEEDYGISYWLDKVEKGDVQLYVAP